MSVIAGVKWWQTVVLANTLSGTRVPTYDMHKRKANVTQPLRKEDVEMGGLHCIEAERLAMGGRDLSRPDCIEEGGDDEVG